MTDAKELEPDTIRKMNAIDEFSITFDDGVELDIGDATPSILADFLEYQGIDLSATSDDAPRIIDWFRARGCQAISLTIDRRVKKWNPWWLMCRYKVWKLGKEFL